MKLCTICNKKPATGKLIKLAKYCDECRKTVLNKQKNNWIKRNVGLNKIIKSRHKYKKNPEKARYYRIKNKYKLNREQYDAMLVKQKHCCAACGTILDLSKTSNIHIDHCHQSGTIRGILCGSCNRCLGLMRDNADNLRKLARYLHRFK